MAPEHVLDVERRGCKTLGDSADLGRVDKQEHGGRVDETTDQPGTGNAVDLRPRSRDPDGAPAPIAFWNLVGGNGRQLGRFPAELTTLQRLGGDAVVAEPRRSALAELFALAADDDHGPAGKLCGPILDVVVRPAHRAGN